MSQHAVEFPRCINPNQNLYVLSCAREVGRFFCPDTRHTWTISPIHDKNALHVPDAPRGPWGLVNASGVQLRQIKNKTADTLPAVRNRAKTSRAFLMSAICLSRPVTPYPDEAHQERFKTRSGIAFQTPWCFSSIKHSQCVRARFKGQACPPAAGPILDDYFHRTWP
jgi:hypothetical protein